jgi:hypothetical protein
VSADGRLVDAVQRQLAFHHFGRNRARRGDDFGAPAIGQRDCQVHAVVVLGQGLGVADHRGNVGGEPVEFADDPQPHAVAVQFGDFAAQIVPQQAHQRVDLVRRPLPVLRREAEQRQIGNSELACRDQRPAHRVGALAMTRDARQAAGLRPAAVAVHDDRDMPRQTRR